MSEELEIRLRSALRAEVAGLPFAVTRQMVEDRLAQRSSRPLMMLAFAGLTAVAAIVAAVLVVAPGSLPRFGGPAAGVLGSDPCALLTVSEVEDATQSTVTSSRLLIAEEMLDPDEPRPCVFETDGQHARISVAVDPTGEDDFAQWRDANRGANLVPLAGIGDEAYSFAGAMVLVRVDSGYFEISSQHGAASPGALADLAELARAAVTKVGADAAESSWAPAASEATGESGADACAVTHPIPSFVAPSPYPAFPPSEDKAWIGTPQLWTMLDRDGEVWDAGAASFPVSVKTFWWSSNWAGMRVEQQPGITVVATRLDGPGRVTTHDATNAAADSLGGEAMLVGIEFPSAGCWELTAEYRGAVLSYIVLIQATDGGG